MDIDLTMQRYEIENKEKWREKINQIPFIQFPADWKVKVIPPFGGAYARFQVELPGKQLKSIYLDLEDRLGYYESPYWEVYPYQDDVGRCDMQDVETLIQLIADTTNKGE